MGLVFFSQTVKLTPCLADYCKTLQIFLMRLTWDWPYERSRASALYEMDFAVSLEGLRCRGNVGQLEAESVLGHSQHSSCNHLQEGQSSHCKRLGKSWEVHWEARLDLQSERKHCNPNSLAPGSLRTSFEPQQS